MTRRGCNRAAKETGDGIRAWLFLRHVAAYEAAWRAQAVLPALEPVFEPGPFPIRIQTAADLEAARRKRLEQGAETTRRRHLCIVAPNEVDQGREFDPGSLRHEDGGGEQRSDAHPGRQPLRPEGEPHRQGPEKSDGRSAHTGSGRRTPIRTPVTFGLPSDGPSHSGTRPTV